MIRYIILSLFLFIGSYSFSQSEQANTWLWQVSGGELQGKSYIFGSMPLQDSTYYRFDPKLWKNINKSDVYISFNQEISGSQQQVYTNSPKQFGISPKDYLKQQVEQKFQPTVDLEQTNSLANLVTSPLNKTASTSQLQELKETYLSADMQRFLDLRTQLDVPEEIFSSLGTKHNYLLISELINQMQLQPVFVAVDPVYLIGSEGLISLFRARGYQVKPLSEKYYEKNAEKIAFLKQQQALFAQQNNPQPNNNTAPNPGIGNGEVISAPTVATTSIKLDLPIGILNLDQWSAYNIDETIDYVAPVRLKQTDENRPDRYQAKYGDLEYQIDVIDEWDNTNTQIEKIIIRNGGQMVLNESFLNKTLSGKHIELMYTDNQISRHLLIKGAQKNLILSIKGPTPAIHTLLADHFFNQIALEQLPVSIAIADTVVTPEVVAPVVQWGLENIKGIQFLFPSEFIQEEAKLEGGETVDAYISSRKVDNNTYIIVTSEKEAFDNFQLFNSSINQAAQEVRGVVVERDVLPAGRPNFAEYIIKDAIDRYYRVQYYHVNGRFYQAIVKGDRKSVSNANANQFFNSIFIP